MDTTPRSLLLAYNERYADIEPSPADIDALSADPILIEFGSPWCGHCHAAQPLLTKTLAEHPRVRHIKIADGKGQPLGRSFRVKLWPTLVFLRDGREVVRLVRPVDIEPVRQALRQIDVN